MSEVDLIDAPRRGEVAKPATHSGAAPFAANCDQSARTTLLLWLEGPLQSWGHDSAFKRRDTLPFPTKSGVLGLLCSARGAGGSQRQWLAKWRDVSMQIQAFAPTHPRFGGVLNAPLLSDFQVTGARYDPLDPWQRLMCPARADGVAGSPNLTQRYYIQDMAFAVYFEGPADLLEECRQALKAPVWDIFLGRKNCIPTEIIGQGLFENPEQARAHAMGLADQKAREMSFVVNESPLPDDPHVHASMDEQQFWLNDEPVSFGEIKRYQPRQVFLVQPLGAD